MTNTIHGTISGYRWHTRKQKELPCEPCREAMKEHWKEQRRVRNSEINVLRRKWRKEQALKHNRSSGRTRARRLGVEYGYFTDQDVIDRYGSDCHICGKPIDFNAPRQCGKPGWELGLQIDHLHPLSKGGSDTMDNVRPAHGYCNNIKHASVDYMHKFKKHDRPTQGINALLQEIAPKSYLDHEPEFIIESFPRSANTFMHGAMRLSWPDLVIKSHNHNPEHIKSANGSVPFISIVRKPEDAIVSWLIYATVYDGLSEWRDIDKSISFYEDNLRASISNDNVFIIPFTEVISNINGILDTLATRYSLGQRNENSNEQIFNYVKDLSISNTKDDDEFKKRGHVPRELHDLHNDFKDKLKPYSNKINELNSLFEIAVSKYYKEKH